MQQRLRKEEFEEEEVEEEVEEVEEKEEVKVEEQFKQETCTLSHPPSLLQLSLPYNQQIIKLSRTSA